MLIRSLRSALWLVPVLLSLMLPAYPASAQDDDASVPDDLIFTEIDPDGADPAAAGDLIFTEIDPEGPAGDSTETIHAADTAAQPANAAARGNGADRPQETKSLWGIFIAGLVGGLAALLMPCIFPMIPLTVSFFTKGTEKKGKAFGKAASYGFYIILIYVFLGLLITVLFGADALNSLSTNGVFNFLFFLLLVVFAASFLGAFEIVLPSSWVDKMDANADKGGRAGLFFMAATLALVSFSCTGPIIGTLLVEAATTGALMGPAAGMFGFSLALAVPFALFALFPSALKALPRSGGWLNSVKVVLGFLELALALKFLSNVDLAYHWEWFDREVFLVLWITIFGLMALYLLGKLRFPHDSALEYISVPRLGLAIVTIAFTLYLIPGLWGAPLRAVSAFLPPQPTQDFDLYTPTLYARFDDNTQAHASQQAAPRKYGDIFHAPLNLRPFFDYDEGLAYARKVNKPVLIDFTGHACVNCRKMEADVWPDKTVYGLISREYVLIQLYVDDKTGLAPADVTTSARGRVLDTIGEKWSDLQASNFQANSQPFYVLLDPHTQKVLVPPQGADYDASRYKAFLDSGLDAFRAL